MAITYTWEIAQLDCYPEYEGKQKVVKTVHWLRKATDNNGHTGEIYGAREIVLNPKDIFTPYNNLTFSEVEGWLNSSFNDDEINELNTILNAQIADQINPPVVTPALPW
jgi:hypothetical protein